MSQSVLSYEVRPLPQVFLRALEPEDLDFLYGIENDATVWKVGCTNVPYSRAVLLDYIASARYDIYADQQVRLIAENGEHEAVGIADLQNFDPRHHRAEVGIVVHPHFRRQRFGEAILRKMSDYAKNVLYLHQIYAIVARNNDSCLRMLELVGFQQTMELKDWLFDGEKYETAYFLQKIL